MPKHCKIAIIWASFAGLATYVMLRKRLWKDADIKIFDMRKKFTYTPGLHECLWDGDRLKHLQFDLATYFPNEFVHEKVDHIQGTHQLVNASGELRSFDYAVIATWSRPQFYDNQTWMDYGYTIRYPEDLPRLNNEIPKADRIAVIWWGITGVEVASVIKQRRPQKHIMLVHSGKCVLDKMWWTYTSKKAEKYLQKQWIELFYGQRLKDLTKKSMILADGNEILSDLTILTAWIRADDEPYQAHLTFKNDYASLESDNIYLVWDAAMHGLMPTAHNAFFEWRRVAHLIADKIEGKQKAYWPLHNWKNLAIALWTKDGIMTFGNKWIYLPFFTGFAKRVVEKRVFFEFKHKILLPV